MKIIIKKLGISILGLLQGTLGSYLAILGIAFAFPESSPGSKDYDEDMFFVPFGFMMLFIWVAVMVVTFLFLRKNKSNLLSFFIPWLVGLVGCLVFVFMIH